MDSDEAESEPTDKAHLHRPMNAFLLFCKQHRPVVRERHPSIENRAVTKILGEWWSNLEEEDKSPYTSLAHQYKEAFMKANPEFRWHKMPPGTADSVPPSNIKPSTPSPANGMVCSPVNGLLSTSNSNFPPSELATSQDASSSPNSSASAPKPFKKRYLASQQSTNSQEPPISPASSLSSAGVSPEQARACEALMELARNESCASRSSEGSERRASPSDTPPMQTLREAVWSKVAGTLLKQVSIFLWRLCGIELWGKDHCRKGGRQFNWDDGWKFHDFARGRLAAEATLRGEPNACSAIRVYAVLLHSRLFPTYRVFFSLGLPLNFQVQKR